VSSIPTSFALPSGENGIGGKWQVILWQGAKIGWEAWTRTRIARSRVWSPTNWTTSQQKTQNLHDGTPCNSSQKGQSQQFCLDSMAKSGTHASSSCMKLGPLRKKNFQEGPDLGYGFPARATNWYNVTPNSMCAPFSAIRVPERSHLASFVPVLLLTPSGVVAPLAAQQEFSPFHRSI
jgi:hypothetical protein